MGWFALDPDSIAARVKASGAPPRVPSLSESLVRGIVGFTLVSVAGFTPWALFGNFFHRVSGEAGMYVACAIVFMALSGLALHRLIIGPGSLALFYKLFIPAFLVYSVAWIAAWMKIGGHTGGIVGLLAGTAAMALFFSAAFGCISRMPLLTAVLFLLNAAGYFGGGVIEHALKDWNLTLAMLAWGVCYGLGFGAALGLSFYLCQSRTRDLLAAAGH
ncbi:MAG TPA: hypothetical protein VEK08_18520 [Planctomycetota bacterium]|nr:hypothetical protein [Planctomycetota bacterium]